MQLIKVPDTAYSRQSVTLNGVLLTLYFKFNIRNESWYIDIYNADDSELLIGGIKVMPNQNLTSRYINSGLPEGSLVCLRVKNSTEVIGRNNLGDNKVYSLYWMSKEDFEQVGIDDNTIQL